MTIADRIGSGLRLGAKGDAVREIQLALLDAGHELLADRHFWKITEAAVKRFQAAHGLKVDGVVGPITAAALDKTPSRLRPPPVLESSLLVAPHLSVMRAITGTRELPGEANSPIILSWVDSILEKHPELKPGVGWYRADATAWCGLGMAYAVSEGGYKPPLAPLWALNWRDAWASGERLDGPCLGAIGVMSRAGGGHVTLYEGEDANGWFGRGCNQSDAVNVQRVPHDRKVTWMWPKGLAVPKSGRVQMTFKNAIAGASEA